MYGKFTKYVSKIIFQATVAEQSANIFFADEKICFYLTIAFEACATKISAEKKCDLMFCSTVRLHLIAQNVLLISHFIVCCASSASNYGVACGRDVEVVVHRYAYLKHT